MSPFEKIYVKEYALELSRLAKADLDAAEVLHLSKKVRGEITLFHVQQAIEKALKAVLCWRGQPVPLAHDLLVVIQKLDSSDLPPNALALQDLTPYGTIRRYEEGMEKIPKELIDAALKHARTVLDWSEKRIQK